MSSKLEKILSKNVSNMPTGKVAKKKQEMAQKMTKDGKQYVTHLSGKK